MVSHFTDFTLCFFFHFEPCPLCSVLLDRAKRLNFCGTFMNRRCFTTPYRTAICGHIPTLRAMNGISGITSMRNQCGGHCMSMWTGWSLRALSMALPMRPKYVAPSHGSISGKSNRYLHCSDCRSSHQLHHQKRLSDGEHAKNPRLKVGQRDGQWVIKGVVLKKTKIFNVHWVSRKLMMRG